MNLRLTDAESEALRKKAEEEGRSMQEVARKAIRSYIDAEARAALVEAALDAELPRYAEALRRLGE